MTHARHFSSAELAERFRAVGDAHRMRIICLLFADTPVCVSDIAGEIGLSVAATSHHLRALAQLGILEPVREGKQVCYRLTSTPFTQDIKRLVCAYRKGR